LHDVTEKSVSLSEFNSTLTVPPTSTSFKRAEKKMYEQLVESDHDSEPDSDSENLVLKKRPTQESKIKHIRLTENDFTDSSKLKLMVYFGTAELEEDEDQHESLSLTFNSKEPKEVTAKWKKGGLRVGKEIFYGFDKTNGVYMPLDGEPLEEQGRFMRIVSKPTETKEKRSLQQMTYLDF